MGKLDKPSRTEFPLRLAIDPEPASETLTALGGMPLLVQAFRSLGLPASVQRQVRIKQRQRGYEEATRVESFVILNAAGGECREDFDRLREDGPKGCIGFAISARMSEGRHAALLAVPVEAWQGDGEDGEVIRECAEVPQCAQREEREEGSTTFVLCRGAVAEEARRVVQRRHGGEAFRGGE